MTAGLIGGLFARRLGSSFLPAFLFLLLSAASHGLLDMLTNGGHGVALFWPWSEARLLAPVRPIKVSPFGVGIFSSRGLAVLLSELLWIWLPGSLLALALIGVRNLGRVASLSQARHDGE